MNPMQMMQMMRNPQQFIQQMMNNSQAMKNPMARNAIEMVQKGDSKGIEEMARNLCKEKGVNPDDMIKQLQSQFGQMQMNNQ